ncbi:MAG: aminopeptidase [Bacteroidales bacterium]|nr:aminopeptidase [Bacteroidales bacterium]
MKNPVAIRLFLLMVSAVLSQTVHKISAQVSSNGYQFEIIKKLAATPVKNQSRSSTCWSFSTLSFIESELLRTGKGETDLSEMFVVRQVYMEKAAKYVLMHGKMNFSGGSEANDVTRIIKRTGIVPEDVYPGMKADEKMHIHGEMDEVLKACVDAVIRNKDGELSPVWFDGFCKLLDAYLGEVPDTFACSDKEYTPASFAEELGLNMNDYIILTSFTHHPFYSDFIIELPDNWSWGKVYNLPLDELVQVIDSSIMNGYTVQWATDNTENGFSFKSGVAINPVNDIEGYSDISDNSNPAPGKEDVVPAALNHPGREKQVNETIRQEEFENYSTTDDHGMHITGIARDQTGKKFYYVKNSWGTGNPYHGYMYVSESYLRFKTITIMVNKHALPEHISMKINLIKK